MGLTARQIQSRTCVRTTKGCGNCSRPKPKPALWGGSFALEEGVDDGQRLPRGLRVRPHLQEGALGLNTRVTRRAISSQ